MSLTLLFRSEPPPVMMTEQYYIAVKASLHSTDSSVFGLDPVEISALSKRFPNSQTPVFNGVLIKGTNRIASLEICFTTLVRY